jgi:hypothetical protein
MIFMHDHSGYFAKMKEKTLIWAVATLPLPKKLWGLMFFVKPYQNILVYFEVIF